MSQNQFERLEGGATAQADSAAALRNEFLESDRAKINQAPPAESRFSGNEKPGQFIELSNPFVKSGDPFQQEGFDDSKGFADRIWHGLKKFVGEEDTLHDQVKKYVEEHKLTAEQKKELKREEELYKEEMDKYHRRMAQIGISLPMPEMPDLKHDPRFAMMRERDRQVKLEEESIAKAVEAKIPGLMPDIKKEMKEYEDSFKIRNPYGTGEGFGPHPVGKTLEVYYEQIRKETERRATGAET